MKESNDNPRKYFIKTYGCQANVADSERLAGVLEALGFLPSKDETSCDIFIANTCSVRQKSEDKVYGLGKIFKPLKSNNPKKPFVILAGCIVGSTKGDRQRYDFSKLKEKTPWVDQYVTPQQFNNIPLILAENGLLDEWQLKKLNLLNEDYPLKLSDPDHAFVNISYGCDNFCTYCVVPYARGEEVSRSKEDIISEVQKIGKKGVSKITLCGQNVNSWGLSRDVKFKIRTGGTLPAEVGEELPFTSLLKSINEIENVKEIDFLSSNPFDFTADLIESLALPKISNYIHIAVQSGNNDILRKMNRRHTVEDFIDLINRIKKVRPDMKIGTDVIVGFPSETREQFMDTVRLFETIPFSAAYISMYSPREGTASQKLMKDDVSRKEKKYRHKFLSDVWKNSLDKNKEEGL